MIHHQTPSELDPDGVYLTTDGMNFMEMRVTAQANNSATVSVYQTTPSQRDDDDTPEPVSNRVTFALLAAGCVALGVLVYLVVRYLA